MNAPAESPLPPSLPTDLAAAHAMILAEGQARIEAQAEALAANAAASSTEVTIAHLKLMIEKLKRELLWSALRAHERLIDQMERTARARRRARVADRLGGGEAH